MSNLSIIVPLFRGKKYVLEIINMVIRNVCLFPVHIKIELILINDYPEESVRVHSEEVLPSNLTVRIFENEINLGIHATRAQGIQKASGEYILLLDQDDRIFDDYLISQWKAIGDADAVVCNGINDYQLLYLSEEQQRKIVRISEWLKGINLIISPGQVLIKKDAIPDIWLKRIMRVNGADDLLLWICMIGKAKRFAMNGDVIYERNIYGNNASLNTEVMRHSLLELCKMVESMDFLSESYKRTFCSNVTERINRSIMNPYRENMSIISNWLRCREEGMNIEELLLNRNYSRIAIYGLGILGKHFYLALKNSKLEIVFGIDKKADMFRYEFPVLKPDDDFPAVDVIVVAVSMQFEEISRYLKQKIDCPVISLQDIFTYFI